MKIFKAIVVTLLLAGLLSVAQHYHDDFDEHDDCPVCALVQHGLDFSDFTPHVAVFWIVLFVLRGESGVFRANPRFCFCRPRGPPLS